MRSGASGTGRRRVRRFLVGVQVALAVILLFGAAPVEVIQAVTLTRTPSNMLTFPR